MITDARLLEIVQKGGAADGAGPVAAGVRAMLYASTSARELALMASELRAYRALREAVAKKGIRHRFECELDDVCTCAVRDVCAALGLPCRELLGGREA